MSSKIRLNGGTHKLYYNSAAQGETKVWNLIDAAGYVKCVDMIDQREAELQGDA